MANEIKKTTKLSWSKGGAQIIVDNTETIDQAGEQAIENVQIIGATSETILFGDVTGSAHLVFKNLAPKWSTLTTIEQGGYSGESDYNTKNTVYIGTTSPVTSGNAQHKITPGGGAGPFISALTWYGIRDTNDVNLLVVAVEV